MPPQPPLALTRRHVALVVTLLLTYGCDARTPTAPAPAPDRPRASATEESQLGSISFEWSAPLAPAAGLPGEKWILVRATGGWRSTRNPACADQPPMWPCSGIPPFSGFWDYPGGAGPVRVAALHGSVWDIVAMRADGGSNGIGLTRADYGRTLLAGPSVYNPPVQVYGNSGPTIDSYIIDGTYTVSASEIASPIRVTEVGADADGTRTFTVEPLYGLKFINPMEFHSPPGAVEWHFFPGDSVGEAPADETYAIRVGACRYQTTCSFRPPGPGRMQVEAYVETQPARARSGTAAAPQDPKLLLTCNGKADSVTVERGQTIRCVASAEPAVAPLVVTGWKFEGGGQTITRDAGTAQQREWTGTMVVPGRITVTGTVNGTAMEASVVDSVTPRVWSEPRPPVYEHVQGCAVVDRANGCYLRYPPDTVRHLGQTKPYWRWTYDLASRAAHIDAGPNSGFSYIAATGSPIMADSVVVFLNKVLFDDRDHFWQKQRTCHRLPLLTWVQAHENKHRDLILQDIEKGIANTYSIEAQVYFKPLQEMRAFLRSEVIPGVQDYVSMSVGDRRHLLYVEQWNALPSEPGCHVSDILDPTPH